MSDGISKRRRKGDISLGPVDSLGNSPYDREKREGGI